MAPPAPPPGPQVRPAPACARPYLPRRPQASPLYRLLADHFAALERVHEERFEPTHGPLRRAARQAVGRLLDCGLLEHGFARVRCATCRAEFLVAFRCKGRHFCPSCHARRLAEWSLWLEEHQAAAMLSWPHSGFGAYLGPSIEERAGVLRVARYSARAPVAESRLRYDAERAEVELVSDRNHGPYAGVHRFSALEFIARWLDHVPERYETRVRYSGAYATRRRVWWRRRGVVLARTHGAPPEATEREESWPALTARRRRWAELLRRVFAVEVERCPRCGGAARILGFVTQPAVAARILAHLARRGIAARAGPWAAAAASPG
jgi:hypothetical protein